MAPRKRIAVLVVGITAVAAVVMAATTVRGVPLYRWILSGGKGEPETIRVSGNIEAIVVEVSFKLAGKVVKRNVDEGDWIEVKKGDEPPVVAELEKNDLEADRDARKADRDAASAALAELLEGSRIEEKQTAKAAVDKAKASWQDLLNGPRPQEIAGAKAAREAALEDWSRTKTEYERSIRLIKNNAISQEDFDRAVAICKVAGARFTQADQQWALLEAGSRQQQILQAEHAYHQAVAQYEQVINGPRLTTIAQAYAKWEQARAALDLAETRLKYATVRAPAFSGMVLSKNVEEGDFVAPGTPVVTIGDLTRPWLRAYINETDLGRVKYGQKVRVTTDTYPGKVYEGTISFIASQAEFTPKNVQTEKERVKLVYRIKIDIPNPKLELKPGMPADAEIIVEE